MGRRDKSRLEKWFSLSRHKRRQGAKGQSSQIATDYARQKMTIIPGQEVVFTHGSANSLEQHFASLRHEFAGQTELHYTHAKIIVLIRRDYKAEKYFGLLEQLWQQEKDFLLKNLNTRWLISAADTFADYSADAATRALALTCSCLINTIKIQETERFIQHADESTDDENRIRQLQQKRLALFDGTSAFTVGTDDTLRNMRWRIDRIAPTNIAGEILREIFLRLQEYETVYRRFRHRHTRNRTGWW
jgi:hypothetical protein